jgi:DNA-binding beta-propeller fold protein YncE
MLPRGFSVHASKLVFAIVAAASPLLAQADMKPTNDAPNPYKTVEGWAKMPEGRAWGSTSAVAIDRDGQSIWVAERCGTNSCVGSTLDPVLHFDKTGKLLKSFGAGMILAPHGIHVDRDGNIWVVDCACTGGGGRGGRGRGEAQPPTAPDAAAQAKGHQIYKFSPDGTLLMTLGKAGGDSTAAGFFFQPNNVITAANGDIWVVEGHGSTAGVSPARVLRFDKSGKPLGQWGTTYDPAKIDEPYGFNQPHALAFDSKGRLFIADRGYNRLKIFDPTNMKLLDTWYQFSRISGLWIDKDDNIYAADSESETVSRNPDGTPSRTDWKRGIRIGSARDGKVVALIPDPWPHCQQGQQSTAASPCSPSTSAAEGIAVDSKGIIYGAEVGPKALKRYEKK